MMMVVEDLTTRLGARPLLSAVTVVSAIHTAYLCYLVRNGPINQTVMTRPLKASFERTRRAHKKAMYFYPIFLLILWTSALFCDEQVAAAAGMVYILGHQMFACFERTGRSRVWHILGYYAVVTAILLLSLIGTFGLLQVILDPYVDFNHILNRLSKGFTSFISR